MPDMPSDSFSKSAGDTYVGYLSIVSRSFSCQISTHMPTVTTMPKKTRHTRLWRSQSWRYFITTFGFILGVTGILCGMFWDQIFESILHREMTLRPNSTVYENWKRPPVNLSLDIYLFNWTNPEEFRNLSTKPILEQCGPYRFTEKPDKTDISWHPHNSSVSYRKKSVFHFDAAGSSGSLSDEITTLNAVALSAASKTKQWNSLRSRLVDMGLQMYNQQMSVSKTVDELLFTGYSDDMITMAKTVSIFGKDVEVPFDKFGWFYTRNNSADLTGIFTVYTGAEDASRIGQMHSWNFMQHSGFFDSYCGMINGSGGEFYPPNLTPRSVVKLFTPDMCRSVPLDYVESVDVEGIRGYKYAGGDRSVDNGTLYPENACFCGGECVPSGVMNVSSCRFGSPVFMSFPHFYKADPSYVAQVEGLKPKQDLHEFYIVLEPKTGVALEVAARFQVNMLVEHIQGVGLYEGVPRIFFPLIWFEQKVRITPKLADELKAMPHVLLGGQIFAGVLFAIGVIMLGWYPVQQLCLLRKKRRSIKVHSAENGNCKRPTGRAHELRPLQVKPAEALASPKTLDNSQLLEHPDETRSAGAAPERDKTLNGSNYGQ